MASTKEKTSTKLETTRTLIIRFLSTRGPVSVEDIQQRYGFERRAVLAVLEELLAEGKVRRGLLTAEAVAEQWCDSRNFEELYRRAITERRRAFAPSPLSTYLAFVNRWHQLGSLEQVEVSSLLQKYRGLQMPMDFFEREIARSRAIPARLQEIITVAQQLLTALCQSGEIVWRLEQEGKGHNRTVQFFSRGEGNLFLEKEKLAARAEALSEPAKALRKFLQENGASFFRDLAALSGLPKLQITEALRELAWAGLVTNDSSLVLRELATTNAISTEPAASQFLPEALPAWMRRSRRYSARRDRRREYPRAKTPVPLLVEGRWSLIEARAILGKELAPQERARRQALLLLERYGLVVKAWCRREGNLLPWFAIFQELKRMEWRGEVRRGYFVEGLSGVQFALPRAAEILAASAVLLNIEEKAIMLSMIDPATPYGSGVGMVLTNSHGNKIEINRQAGNHLLLVGATPVIYAENFGLRLWPVAGSQEKDLQTALGLLKQFLELPEALRPRKRIEVELWNGVPITRTPAAIWLQRHGFEIESDKVVLWPSRVD